MNVWNWTSFFSLGLAASGSKVFAHFFPVAAGVSAPYAVEAALEVFAGGKILAQQAIEGLRLNQPDGVDLAHLFPHIFSQQLVSQHRSGELGGSKELGTAKALYGLSIQLGTQQPRIDLSRSRIVIEVAYPSHRLRYHAVQSGHELSERYLPESAALFAHEGFDTRIIELNPDVASSAIPAVVGGSYQDALLPGCSVRSVKISPARQSSPLSVSTSSFDPESSVLESSVLGSGGSSLFDTAAALGQKEDGIVRFLVRYERSSELPVSVRSL